MAIKGGQDLKMEHSDFNKVPGTTNNLTNDLKIRGQSRKRLLEYLSTRKRAPYYRGDVCNLARNHPPFLHRMNLMKKLPVHDGCVNTICWNKTGEYILSGSDDRNLCITKPTYMFDESKDYSVTHKVQTHHLGNIFSAQFIPYSSDNLLVSCSSDGPVIVHDIKCNNPSQGIFNYNCHSSTIHEVVPLQDDGDVFLSCGEDKTVRLFDMRCHRSCARASTCPHPALIRNSAAMTTLSIHPMNSNLLLVGRADGLGLLYDRRKLPDVSKFSREKAHLDYLAGIKDTGSKYMSWVMNGVVSRFSVPDMDENCRFTSLCFSASGDQVLASYSQDYIYLFSLDKSTNFELIQTLPRNYSTNSSSSVSGSGGGSNNSDDNNDRGRASNQTGRRGNTRESITPRIRVRGDWSDTGINSVPHSRRQTENNSSQQTSTTTTNFLQRMTEVAFSLSARRNSSSSRFVPMSEILTVPSSYQPSGAESHGVPSGQEQDEDEDDNDEEEGEEEEEEEEEEGEEEVEDEEESNMEESVGGYESTFDLLGRLDDSTTNHHHQAQRKKSSREENEQVAASAAAGNAPKSGGVSTETKLKFKKTFEDLKTKFNAIPIFHPRVRYQGHRNSRTSFKQAIFWGDDYIMSGSDCGRIMIWERETAKLVTGFPADERVVNCLAPNPHHYALASSGIDYDIKLWSTQNVLEAPLMVSKAEMDTIVRNNELMLEEAKQTITVPPHLFFRVLASLAQNRLS